MYHDQGPRARRQTPGRAGKRPAHRPPLRSAKWYRSATPPRASWSQRRGSQRWRSAIPMPSSWSTPSPARCVTPSQLPGAARHLGLAAPDGPVPVPLENSNQLWEVSIPDGRVAATVAGVGRQPHDAAQTTGGTIVVTNEVGGGVVFVRDCVGGGGTASRPGSTRRRGGGRQLRGGRRRAGRRGVGLRRVDAAAGGARPGRDEADSRDRADRDLAAFADTEGAPS